MKKEFDFVSFAEKKPEITKHGLISDPILVFYKNKYYFCHYHMNECVYSDDGQDFFICINLKTHYQGLPKTASDIIFWAYLND